MITLNIAQLAQIYPQATRSNIEKALPSLNDTLKRYNIDTVDRVACFLGQLGQESGELRFTRELWGPTYQQRRYEGRKDLGNTVAGDGYRFRGRGLIQTTGRANYGSVSRRLNFDFITNPDALSLFPWAALSAGDYWDMKNLNPIADNLDVETITKKVNGGYTALDERIDYTNNALRVLGETARVKKKRLIPILTVIAVSLVLILLFINRKPILSWMQNLNAPPRLSLA